MACRTVKVPVTITGFAVRYVQDHESEGKTDAEILEMVKEDAPQYGVMHGGNRIRDASTEVTGEPEFVE